MFFFIKGSFLQNSYKALECEKGLDQSGRVLVKIVEIAENKKQFLALLLLADEQESMVDKYLEQGTMFVLDDDGVKAECVVTDEGNGIIEVFSPGK